MSYDPYNQNSGYVPPVSYTQTNVALKNSFGKGTFMAVAILASLNVVLAIVGLFTPGFSIAMLLEQYGREFGLSYSQIQEAENILNSMQGSMVVGAITSLIEPLLIVAAYWLIWTASRRDSLPTGTAGFTIMKVLTIIGLVLVSIAGVIILILMIPAIIGGSAAFRYFDIDVSATLLIVLFFLVLIAIMVLVIIYYAKLVNIWTAAKDIASVGVTTKKVSMFVIVFNFIGMIGTFVGIFSNLVLFNYLGSASQLVTFLLELFLTITFIKFRSQLDKQQQMAPPTGPTAPYGQYNYPPVSSVQNTGYQQPYPSATGYNPQAYGSNQGMGSGYQQTGYQNYQQPQQPAYQQPYQNTGSYNTYNQAPFNTGNVENQPQQNNAGNGFTGTPFNEDENQQ